MEENEMRQSCKVVLIGGSSGSLDVLLAILPKMSKQVSFSIVVVLHRKNSVDSTLSELLTIKSSLPVREVEDKDQILPGHVYLAPADYHLLFEKTRTFSLDDSEKINFSRPSIDVTFESAAEVYGSSLICILLSGANADGTLGLIKTHEQGGTTIVQDPDTASAAFMPNHALLHAPVDYKFNAEQMVEFLGKL